jgi:hypothetical protein
MVCGQQWTDRSGKTFQYWHKFKISGAEKVNLGTDHDKSLVLKLGGYLGLQEITEALAENGNPYMPKMLPPLRLSPHFIDPNGVISNPVKVLSRSLPALPAAILPTSIFPASG